MATPIYIPTNSAWVSLVAQTVKNLPAMRETWVQFLGWEDPLEEGMATHSSILAWRIPWTEEPGGLQFMGLQRVRHNLMNEQSQQISYFYHASSGYVCVCVCVRP